MSTDAIHTDMNEHFLKILGVREQYRDLYWQTRDPICEYRLKWRACSFRHIVHLLPNQSILELGCGQGLFTKQLFKVSRGENPITAATFNPNDSKSRDQFPSVEYINLTSFPGKLEEKKYDFVIAIDLLDKSNCTWFLNNIYRLLNPGGQVLFYESNPWNIALKFRQFFLKLLKKRDPRQLLNRSNLYEIISEIGFIRIFAVYNDFVYAPLSRSLIWLLRNLSIMLENLPFIRTLAGSILIHAQKPPRILKRPKISLFRHEKLKKSISFVIPCHNEEMNIIPLVSQLKAYYDEYIHEIILVDDNSSDETATIIQELTNQDKRINSVFRLPPNGVGRAISDGYKLATGRYVLSMDCDFQHLLPEFRDLFDAAAEDYDVVVGSRFSRLSVLLNYPFLKIVANRGFHTIARFLFMRHFRDLTNNLKLMKQEVVGELNLTQTGFAVNAETGFQPLLMDYSVKEVPISWINRSPDMGMSSFKLVKVGGGYWQVLFRLFLKNPFSLKKITTKITTK